MGIVPQEALAHLGVRDLSGVSLEESMVKLKALKEQRDQERIGSEREKEPPAVTDVPVAAPPEAAAEPPAPEPPAPEPSETEE